MPLFFFEQLFYIYYVHKRIFYKALALFGFPEGKNFADMFKIVRLPINCACGNIAAARMQNGKAYFFRWLSQPLEVVACLSGVHHMASTPSSDSTSFCPSSSGIQNRAVVRQSAMPESGHSTVTPL